MQPTVWGGAFRERKQKISRFLKKCVFCNPCVTYHRIRSSQKIKKIFFILKAIFRNVTGFITGEWYGKHVKNKRTKFRSIEQQFTQNSYEIFASLEPGITEPTYRVRIKSDEMKQTFIDFTMSRTVIDTGIVPTAEDRILTTSACTGHGHDIRWVVQARPANETVMMLPQEAAEPTTTESVTEEQTA